MRLFGLFVLVVCFAQSSSLSESEKEEEIENALLKAIAEEEKELQGKEGVDHEEEEEDLDEIDLDEIYAKHDPFWWSSKSKQNTGHRAIRVNGSQPRKPATRRWLRIKQKAKSFLHGAHKVVTKAQEYAPHILKGIKYGAMLLGKKKRELRALETRQKHLKRQIQILEDEVMKKKK